MTIEQTKGFIMDVEHMAHLIQEYRYTIGNATLFADPHEPAKIVGKGGNFNVNGTNVNGLPFTDRYPMHGKPWENINNYITTTTAKRAPRKEM